MPEADTAALDVTCVECGRSPWRAEVWRVLFADIRVAVTYCPESAERSLARQLAEGLDQR